jgi:hypothetical protein
VACALGLILILAGPVPTRELATEIEINAPAETVWAILTDLDRFAEWNPFIREIEGEVRQGARLRVRIEPPEGKGMTFTPTVTRVDPPRQFSWLGRLVLPGVFDGEHIFEIFPAGAGRVRLVQREEFSGLLVPLLWSGLDTDTRQGFESMNTALKERAESR